LKFSFLHIIHWDNLTQEGKQLWTSHEVSGGCSAAQHSWAQRKELCDWQHLCNSTE